MRVFCYACQTVIPFPGGRTGDSGQTYRIAVVGGRVAAAEDAARVVLGVAPIGWPTVSPDAQKQQQAMQAIRSPYSCLKASPRTD